MTITPLFNGFVSIDGTDYSGLCTKASPKRGAADNPRTVINSGTEQHGGGLGSASIDVEFFVDSDLISDLWDKVGTLVEIVYRFDAGAASATNWEWTGDCLLTEFVPADAGPGDDPKWSSTLPCNGWSIDAGA